MKLAAREVSIAFVTNWVKECDKKGVHAGLYLVSNLVVIY